MQKPTDWLKIRPELRFDYVQKMVFNRVFSPDEKGMKRHGKGRPLFEQPAFVVRPNNPGFFAGQAMKKIIEAQEWEGDSAEGVSTELIEDSQIEEYLDAIAYLQFEILWILNRQTGGEEDEAEKV